MPHHWCNYIFPAWCRLPHRRVRQPFLPRLAQRYTTCPSFAKAEVTLPYCCCRRAVAASNHVLDTAVPHWSSLHTPSLHNNEIFQPWRGTPLLVTFFTIRWQVKIYKKYWLDTNRWKTDRNKVGNVEIYLIGFIRNEVGVCFAMYSVVAWLPYAERMISDQASDLTKCVETHQACPLSCQIALYGSSGSLSLSLPLSRRS